MVYRMEDATNKDLNDILFKNSVTKRYYIGTFPACLFPIINSKKATFITNTDEHDNSGEHWNAWVVVDDCLTFFDSFGRSPLDITLPKQYHDFAKTFKKYKYVKYRVQDWSSNMCGYFCVHFIYILSCNLEIKHFLADYTTNFENNDQVVIRFYSSIYSRCFI